MKKYIFTLLTLLISVFHIMAQGRNATMRISLSDRSPLVVVIDGRHYDKAGNELTIGNLPPGRHEVKVYSYYQSRMGRRNNADLVYKGFINIQSNRMYYCTVNPDRRTMQIRTETTVPYNDNNRRYQDFNDGYYDSQYDYQREDLYREQRNPRVTTAPRTKTELMNNSQLLNANDMETLRVNVEDRITDGDKLKSLQTALGQKYYSSSQVRNMMQWLNFESTRLEFAKWAYEHVSDPGEYWKLESEFTYSSSKTEFSNYIRR